MLGCFLNGNIACGFGQDAKPCYGPSLGTFLGYQVQLQTLDPKLKADI